MNIEITNEPSKSLFSNINVGDIFQDFNRNILIKTNLIYIGDDKYNCVNLKTGNYFYINDSNEVYILIGNLFVDYL